MQDNDAVVLFNFRADRMVEISKAFEYEDFNSFDRKRFPKVASQWLVKIFAIVLSLWIKKAAEVKDIHQAEHSCTSLLPLYETLTMLPP